MAAAHPSGLDVPARLRIFADSYGLSPRDRAEFHGVIEQATEVCRTFVAARVAVGDPAFLEARAERGRWEHWDRLQTWLVDHLRRSRPPC
jgi:hypothetical protein